MLETAQQIIQPLLEALGLEDLAGLVVGILRLVAGLVASGGLFVFLRNQIDPLRAYRAQLRAEIDKLPTAFADLAQKLLEDVYVDLALDPKEHADPERLWQRRTGGRGAPLEEELTRRSSGLWVLIGDPGSGKTMLVRQYALKLLKVRRGLIPIVLRLADPKNRGGLAEALKERYGKENADRLMARVVRGRAVLLLDGLDEVGDPELAQAIVVRFVGDAEACRVVITSRRIGYVRLGGAAELYLVPLDAAQQHTLLVRWLDDPARADRALRELAPHPKMRELATNPLLLTLIAMVVKRSDGAPLPVLRTSLYEEALQYLLDRRKPVLPQRVVVRELLAAIALSAHGTPDGMSLDSLVKRLERERIPPDLGDAEAFLRKVAEHTGLLDPEPRTGPLRGYSFPHRTFQEYLAAVALARVAFAPDGAPRPPLAEVIGWAVKDAGTWSEVLALTCGLLPLAQADALVRAVIATEATDLVYRVLGDAERISPEVIEEALKIDRDPEQWEARRKLIEVDLPEIVGRNEPAKRVLSLVEWFAGTTWHGADLFFAQRVISELAAGRCGALQVPPELRPLAADKAREFWRNHRPAERRAALEALDAWGWGEVPAGDHPLGSQRGRRKNPPRTQHLVQPFEMGAVPVVNAVYELFDPGHRAERGLGADEGFPVVNVTWYEAAAFAAWLAAEPGRDRVVRLPTEVEWELGARGGTATEYWSGDAEEDLAKVGWYDNNSGRRLHRVGELPANAYGLRDVHGNVREWCADAYDAEAFSSPPAPYDPADPPPASSDPSADRVSRGGDWNDDAQLARSSFRGRYQPDGRLSFFGLRLVRAPAPPAGSRR